MQTLGNPRVMAKIDATVVKAFNSINARLPASIPPNATIAVFPPDAEFTEYSEFALESLTVQFVNSGKYTVVEKRRVQELLAEYDFQNSGMVGEKTLGELLGADVVIFSSLSDDGSNLNVWAVDTAKRTTLTQLLAPRTASDSVAIRPITGGANNEAATVTSFLENNRQLLSLGSVDMEVSGSVQQVGTKSKLTLGVRSSITGTDTRWVRSMDYADALELWVKLPAAIGYVLKEEAKVLRLRRQFEAAFGFAWGEQDTRSANSGTKIGIDNYNPLNAATPRPVPANFIKLDRISQRGIPSGGFYIGATPVTQREYESIMKTNPSENKNPNNPVTNISARNAMIFCNLMSIRDGLEPAYSVGWTVDDIDLDLFASGYRLPGTHEFLYARRQIEGMGNPNEFVYDGAFVFSPGENTIERSHSSPSRVKHIGRYDEGIVDYWVLRPNDAGKKSTNGFDHLSNPTFRLVRPILDYWQYTSGDKVRLRTEVY
jgi:hypothetical protein